MKKGSLVVVKKGTINAASSNTLPYIKWLPIDDEETIYTIREIVVYKQETGALLEEGIIGYSDNGKEMAIEISYLIEIQPPMEINELLENKINTYEHCNL